MPSVSPHPVALVTGASRGIGSGIARRMAAMGYQVVVNYFRNRAAADAVVQACESAGGAGVAIQADVGDAGDRDGLIEATWQRFGRIDVLVNNAGITSPGRKDVLEVTEEGWDRVFATNLKGPFFLSQRAARRMLEAIELGNQTRGVIVNISSISAIALSTNRADYCIAKSAMKMMTELFAVRLAEDGVRVYEVCPGVIESDMTAPVREKYDRQIAGGLTPIRRWGKPEDVADVVAILAEGRLDFTTGERIFVDGGFHIRRL